MKFEIIGLKENYGKHRYSNNVILSQLNKEVKSSPKLLFVWWTEKMFLSPDYVKVVDRLCKTEWFGVMHVPLLTPNWAMYSQNNLAKLYFMERWGMALKKCKGIIALSKHMKEQLSALYPDLNVFSLKHPIQSTDISFDYEAFCQDPKLLLVGTWLRNFDGFYDIKVPWRKKLIINHYTEDFMQQCYHKYRPGMLEDIKSIDHVNFLKNKEYDELICSSLLYLNLHETSANNALCECISYTVPFIAKRHPAIVEYCGSEYPLFVDDDSNLQISREKVREAHIYLKERQDLRDGLSMQLFIREMRNIWQQLC